MLPVQSQNDPYKKSYPKGAMDYRKKRERKKIIVIQEFCGIQTAISSATGKGRKAERRREKRQVRGRVVLRAAQNSEIRA